MNSSGEDSSAPEGDRAPSAPEEDRAPADGGALPPLAAFLAAGWVLGAFEGAFVARPGSRLLVIAFSAVLASAVGLLLGGAVALAVVARRRIPRLRRLRAGFPRADDRAFWMRLSALVVAAFAVVVPMMVILRSSLRAVLDLQEQGLGRSLADVFVAFGLVTSIVLVLVLERLALRLLGAIDRRRRIPLPPPPWFAALVLVAFPAFVVVYPVVRQHGGVLGVARDAATVVFLAVAGLQAWLLLLLAPARRRRIAAGAVVAVAFAALAVVAVLAKRRAAQLGLAERGAAASLGGRVARRLTDVDGDGVSSLFGGLDCAPFDSKRSPNAREIAGNGVDENCDGRDDAEPVTPAAQRRFSGALSASQVRHYNLVWLVLETVRSDHVNALGYDKPTMPYLASLARESLLFTRAYAQSTATVLSVPSMLSGIDPGMAGWGVEHVHPQLADDEVLLAERLRNLKYKTGFVLDQYMRDDFKSIQRGMDELLLCEPDAKKVHNRPRRNLYSTAKAAEFLASVKPKEPFFLVVYYPDQHSPYTRHKDVDSSAFASGELGDYDTELAFADEQIRALVELLKARRSVWDDTIVVVNADHGEEFGEHGGDRHAKTCYEEVAHVPLVVRIPGIASKRIDSPVGLVDVVPTVLELLGDTAKADARFGQSLLVPALRPEQVDPERPLFCSIASITNKYGTFFRRAVRTRSRALIEDVDEGKVALYDTERDPREQADLSGDPTRAAELQALKTLLEASLTGNLRDHTKMVPKKLAKDAR